MRRLSQPTSGLLSYFTRHGTAANLLLVVLVVAGLMAFPKMRAQFFPDVVVDYVRVSVVWEGAGASDVDNAIVQVMEPALLAVEGVESTESRSVEGNARITLNFEPGWDMARAEDSVEAVVDSIDTLPEEAEEPTVRRGVWRDRVTDVVITGPLDPEQLGQYTDEFVARLFAEGVTRTTIRGFASPETLIEVSMVDLMTHDLSIAQIAAAVAQEVNADPAGAVDGANARVRTGIEKRAPDQIAAIVLRSNSDGSKLTIGDVATVRVEAATRQRAYFVGNDPAISIRIDRSDKGDAIGIQETVEEVAAEMQATLPQGTTIELIRTRAEAITGRLNILLDNGAMGLVLVLCLLFLFLNARIAFWVAAGIPTAMLATVAMMFAFGFTINMISLFALIITLGIVVDDAIVVGEHADARARRLGEAPFVAAENAARRMAMPVFSSTLTTVIAFFGLTVISGRFGELIADVPFTVIVVLLASLVECFLILPNHMAHALKHTVKDHWYDWPSRKVNQGFRWVREVLFRPFIRFVIWARYPVLGLAIVALASQLALFIQGDVKWRFFNAPERSSVTGNFIMLPSATRQDAEEMRREMQRATEALAREYEEKYGTNPLDYVLTQLGGTAGYVVGGSDTLDPDLLGGIAIELIDPDLRPYSSFKFVADLQGAVVKHPLVDTLSFRGFRSGPGGDSLDVQFYGADAQTLKQASETLKTALLEYPEVSAVEDNLAYDKEELILELTPQGRALGFAIDDLGRVLRHRLNGLEAATYPDGPRSAAIRVELPAGELTANFIEATRMRTPGGEYVPLADLVTVERQTGFSTVRRENGIRLINVTGDISQDDPARAVEIERVLEEVILPGIASELQVDWDLAGLSEQEDTFLQDARFGLIICLMGIYLVLAWVFSSWVRPVVVMAIIPFGLVGTIYGHYYHEVPLSMFTVVGLLGMTGIIINDSIVLVSTIDEYAEERGLFPSIIDGAADRLRPVFLTTATTVLGLAPLLSEKSQQAQFLKPTVITLVYGLGFGMVLVLLVVPSLLAVQADIQRQVTALRRAAVSKVLGGGLWALGALLMAWAGVTVGAQAVTGAPLPFVSSLLGAVEPVVTGVSAWISADLGLFVQVLFSSPVMLIFVLFFTGAALACVLAYFLARITFELRQRMNAG